MKPGRWTAVFALFILVAAIVTAFLTINWPGPRLRISRTLAPTLVVIVPDSFNGTLSLWPPDVAATLTTDPLVVHVDARGRGTLSDPSIVNDGFVLDMRRESGERIPFVVFKSGAPGSGDYCMLADNGPHGACVAWTIHTQAAPTGSSPTEDQ